jgi:ABC-type transport system involved in cytochrome c biogenesis permease subunit
VAATYTVANASGGTPGANTCVVANTLVALTGAQTCTVTGLANGSSYTFVVTPSGSAASPGTTLTSTQSLASASIEVGVNFLAAPTVAYAASGSALVSFAADGVASTYVVTSTPGGFTCTVINSTTAPTGAQHCTVSGLTLGTSYTFTVTPSGSATSPGTTLTSTASLASASIEVGVNFLAAPTVAYASSGSALVSLAA